MQVKKDANLQSQKTEPSAGASAMTVVDHRTITTTTTPPTMIVTLVDHPHSSLKNRQEERPLQQPKNANAGKDSSADY
jgi:hypothetical protein